MTIQQFLDAIGDANAWILFAVAVCGVFATEAAWALVAIITLFFIMGWAT